MKALLQVVTALASARSFEEVISVVRRDARALMRSDGVTFVLRDADMCHYVEEDAIAPLWKGLRFPLGACISGWVMQHREPAVIPDIYADPRIPHEAYRATFVRSLAIMPVGDEAPLGAIGAYWATSHSSTGKELQILRALAEAAALAMRNACLNAERDQALAHACEARRLAEDANHLKDDFLATLSHEFRSPLCVTKNWVARLQCSHPPDELRRGLDVIERNTLLQSRLVEDLLDLTRASAGQLKIHIQPIDLLELCSATVEAVRPSAQAKSIRLELLPRLTPRIWGDPDRIQQMLSNVLHNAIKFTPKQGTVRVLLLHEGHRVMLMVEDTGIGIDPEFLPFVFDRFRQANPASAGRHGGLGLGLNIVRELARLHGATVQARSGGINQGTTISIEFPMPTEPQGSVLPSHSRTGIPDRMPLRH